MKRSSNIMKPNALRFAALLLVACSLFALIVAGCSTTLPGLTREQALYRDGTNAVAFIHRFVEPAVPVPWNGVVAGVNGLATALLALWNTKQGTKLRMLAKGQAANNGAVVVKN